MPIIQFVCPQDTADAIKAEADSRIPEESVSRVVAEVVIPAFAQRVSALKLERGVCDHLLTEGPVK